VKHIRTVCIIFFAALALWGCCTSNFPLHLASALDRLEHGPVKRKPGPDTLSVSEMYPDNPQAQALVRSRAAAARDSETRVTPVAFFTVCATMVDIASGALPRSLSAILAAASFNSVMDAHTAPPAEEPAASAASEGSARPVSLPSQFANPPLSAATMPVFCAKTESACLRSARALEDFVSPEPESGVAPWQLCFVAARVCKRRAGWSALSGMANAGKTA